MNSFLCVIDLLSLISNEFTKKTEISLILTHDIISSNPLVEFLVHRPDSIASLSNYPAIYKIAFYATFPTSQLDSEVFSSILVALEQDFYYRECFDAFNFELWRRYSWSCNFHKYREYWLRNDGQVAHFSRFTLLRDFTRILLPKSSKKRILMRSGGVKKSSDLIWQKVKGLSPKSSPKSRSTVSNSKVHLIQLEGVVLFFTEIIFEGNPSA